MQNTEERNTSEGGKKIFKEEKGKRVEGGADERKKESRINRSMSLGIWLLVVAFLISKITFCALDIISSSAYIRFILMNLHLFW